MSTADSAVAGDEWVPMGIAVSLTGYSARTLRNLVDEGQIAAVRTDSGRWLIQVASIEDLRRSVSIGEACRLSGRTEDIIRGAWDRGDLAGFRTASGQRRVYRDSLTAWGGR